MALFCAVITRDSVSLLKFPFLNQVQVLSCEILLISRLKRPWSCFSSHFCFLSFVILFIYRVVIIVSDGCNQSSFVSEVTLSLPVRPDIVLFLCQFVFYEIKRFISVTNNLFCCLLSIYVLIKLVLMALFCTIINKDFLSFLKFPLI